MGTNHRYADAVDRRMDERVAQVAMRDQSPLTLTADELELHREPLTRSPVARPARAWVRYGTTAVLLDVEVVEWTEHAVHARWITPDGAKHHAWLWASSVRSRD